MRSAYFFIALIVILIGCSSKMISMDDADVISQKFIREHVKFYSGVGNVTSYSVELVSGELNGDQYDLIMEVSGIKDGAIKKNQMPISVDARTGKVLVFNGVAVIN